MMIVGSALLGGAERRSNMKQEKKLAIGLGVGAMGWIWAGTAGDMSLVGILTLLAAVGTIGAVTSHVFTLIRIVFPVLDEELAQFASLGLAVVVGLLARFLLPYAAEAPAWVDQYLPYLIYLAEQIYFLLNKDTPAFVEARALGAAYYE